MAAIIGRHGILPLRNHAPGLSLSTSCSSHKTGRRSTIQKTTAVLSRAITEKRERWQSKIGTETRNPDGNSRPGVTADRVRRIRGTFLSHTAKPKEKWSAEIDAVWIAVKRKHLAQKWQRKYEERETELFRMVEVAATDEKKEERERCMIRDQLVGG